MAQMRQEKTNKDFYCKNGEPAKVNKYGGMLKHATNVYTLVLFKMFEDEFSLSTGLSCVETNHHDDGFTFSLVGSDNNKMYMCILTDLIWLVVVIANYLKLWACYVAML